MVRKIIPDVVRGQDVASVARSVAVHDAARLMREHDVGAVLVVESQALKGILTVNDVTCRVVAEGRDPEKTTVGEVMTPDPDVVGPATTAIEALRLMQDGSYRHLPVVEDGRILGVVSRRDFYGLEKARLDDETALWEHIG